MRGAEQFSRRRPQETVNIWWSAPSYGRCSNWSPWALPAVRYRPLWRLRSRTRPLPASSASHSSLVFALASYGYWTAFAPASRGAHRMTTSLLLARGCDGPFHADSHIRASVEAVRSCSGLPCPTR
jgi:hypothetical protein